MNLYVKCSTTRVDSPAGADSPPGAVSPAGADSPPGAVSPAGADSPVGTINKFISISTKINYCCDHYQKSFGGNPQNIAVPLLH